MICPKCGGGGKVYCTMCKGTGLYHEEDGITNEEWFINLPTKEKAKALDLLMDGMSDLRFEIEEILNNGDFDMTHEEAVEIWLKQPHKK